jgi:heterodisulfide reductase subunit A-like polyferredoxin/coenzyme F420-reducing hydrogenase delta subunit
LVRSKSNGKSGVILCDCNGELNRKLDFSYLEKKLNELSTVARVKRCSRLCNSKDCADTVKALKKSGISRLAVGGCENDTLDTVLRDTVEKNGLDTSLIWPVNICEQCGLVHTNKKEASEKAYRRISAAVNRVKLAEPLKTIRSKVNHNAVVIGAGIAGKHAALALANLGHKVAILQKENERDMVTAMAPEFHGYLGEDPRAVAKNIRLFDEKLNKQIKKHKKVKSYSEMKIHSIEGDLGNFTINMAVNGDSMKLRAGGIVIASAPNTEPVVKTMKIGELPKVVDMMGLLKLIRSGDVSGNIAIIAGYYQALERSVSAQVLSAAEILVKRFGAQVKVYCSNVQVAATGLECLYRRTRSAGVVILKSNKEPEVTSKGSKLAVKSEDSTAGIEVSDEFDLVVIADSQSADNGSGDRSIFDGLRAGPDGALQADNVWLLPALTNRPGIYVIGDARGNSEYREALTDGLAAANGIHGSLAGKQLEMCDDAAAVDSGKCVLCLTCLRLCPHGAISIDVDENAARVSNVSCQRCGICASECPAKAIAMPGYTDTQITAEVGESPRITVFACKNSAVPAANAAAVFGFKYDPKVELIEVPCSGRVDTQAVLSALAAGAEKVIVLGCHPESCKYLTGSSRSSGRIKYISSLLEKAGFDSTRVLFGGIASVESPRFIEYVTGKSPIR